LSAHSPSGRNFVETLKDPETRAQLFGPGGTSARLARFFERPEILDADKLLAFYGELVRVPLRMTTGDGAVQREGERLLGKKAKTASGNKKPATVRDGSYNSMDFLRCFSNVMTTVYGAPEVMFTPALWKKMLQCQSHPSATLELLEYFTLDMEGANGLIGATEGMNWTTLLVFLCEVRQAMADDRAGFVVMLEKLEARPGLIDAVQDVVVDIVAEGAKGKDCYCTRVCARVHDWLDGVGSVVRTDDEGVVLVD
jgi:hypothetical protein